jgi:tetratricopeptide (TPR) repeat protein
MNIQEFKNNLDQLDTLHQQCNYESALRLTKNLLSDFPYSVEILIKYAKLIQLMDKDNLQDYPSLEESMKSLLAAYILSDKSIDARIELGYFEYALKDSANEAIKYFNEAEEIAKAGLKSAMIGQIKCHLDISNIPDAKEVIEKAKMIFPNDGDIEILEFELEDR